MDEMEKFLKKHKLPQFTKHSLDNLRHPKTMEEIEFTIGGLPENKSPVSDCFSGEVYHTF